MHNLFNDVDRVREQYLATLRALGKVEAEMEAAGDTLTPQAVAAQLLLVAALADLGELALRLRDTAIALRPAPAGAAIN